MYIGKGTELSRRAFMHRSSQLAVMGAASSYALGLAGIGEAAAFQSGGGYKALVCVFLLGGNDHGNTLIPYDQTNYNLYRTLRSGTASQGGIALERGALAATLLRQPDTQTLTDDMQLALAPTMPNMAARFGQGVMAPLLNVGPLIVPLTKAQYESGDNSSFPRPSKLFSHNDQQSTWQSSAPEGSITGWGGRMGDLAQDNNTNAMFTAISAAGNSVFLSGDEIFPYGVSTSGAIEMSAVRNNSLYGSASAGQALATLLRNHSPHVFEADYAMSNARSIQFGGFINSALSGVNLATQFPNSSLGSQLRVVARLIAARASLGVTRQVFMVATGGYDNHDGLIGTHEGLLGDLDASLDAFYRATLETGVADRVTAFTASDFGRTLTSNGDGSDHGWGGHHFILGGSVNGGQFYGRAPQMSVSSNDQVGRGRLLPGVSVDEYSATLAKWFGVSPSEIPSISPNIGRFASPDLGFLRAPVT